MASSKKAVVLLSGGLDSATILAIAVDLGFDCYALSFDYGQRHETELDAARTIAQKHRVKQHMILPLGLDQIGGSALTDTSIALPTQTDKGIPVTYVPARNTIFLSYGLAWAEVLAADDLFIGVNALDYSGYPDCRPEYINAYEQMANLATKRAVEGGKFNVQAPLLNMSKAEIIKKGIALGVDYSVTVSCYQADSKGRACGRCDACRLRKQGFADAGVSDPTAY